jgi:FkbH-like protein
MRIQLEDIAVFAVSWDDKPASLRRIAASLNIGLDALTLVDDNPAERDVVRRLVPEVDVIALPPEPAGYRRTLAEYTGFETAAITDEDRHRTETYRALAAAAELASATTDIDAFHRDLGMEAVVGPFDDLNVPRIVQLINKTNQFNLTTRRHGLEEVRAFIASPVHVTRYLKLRDRFTDHGLVALAVAEIRGETLVIDTLLMSCRVIGRTVEAELLASLCRAAEAAGCTVLEGTYCPTTKNVIVKDLYARFGFVLVADEDGTTVWRYDLATQGAIAGGAISVVEP